MKRFPIRFYSSGLALILAVVCQSAAHAKNIFVSPSGNGTDGSSWTNAIQDPGKIDWSKVASGDHIILDGGAVSTTYTTSMTVPKSNIVIRQSNEAGHNGQVILRGALLPGAPTLVGLTINGSNVHVVGVRRSGIKLLSYATQGISVKANNCTLRNVEVNSITGLPPYGSGRIGGVTFGGYNNQFIGCDFRDTINSAVSQPLAGGANMAVFRNCTFGSNSYGWWGEYGTALTGSSSGGAVVYADHCVFGPYVNYGVSGGSDRMHISNSLFLAASVANVNFQPTSASAALSLDHCTLYEKKLIPPPVPYMPVEKTISANGTGTLRVRNTIVWGGIVDVPASQVISGGGNVQYAVSGNTVALAPSLIDPQFVDNAALSAPSAPASFIPRLLTTLDFAPQAQAALNKGSNIVRVSDITAPYGPPYGLPVAAGGP